MLNYKIENVSDQFFDLTANTPYTYKFKGQEHVITPEYLKDAPRELQQSFGNFAKKVVDTLKKPQPKPVACNAENGGGREKRSTYIPELGKYSALQNEELVRRELKRIARVDTIVMEKLNMPKVFQALLTQPHTALDQLKGSVETEHNLTLIIDSANAYWTMGHGMLKGTDPSLPKVMYEQAQKIKGIEVVFAHGLREFVYKNVAYREYTDFVKALPERNRRKIMVLTQGCGASDHYTGIKDKLIFCTPFRHGNNCGCSRIYQAEQAKMEMYYDINNATSLSKIK